MSICRTENSSLLAMVTDWGIRKIGKLLRYNIYPTFVIDLQYQDYSISLILLRPIKRKKKFKWTKLQYY